MFSEFKTFIARGNVLDLAVGVIIGAAFGKIVTSLTDDIIMPIIGWLSGGVDFSSRFVLLGSIPADFKGDPTKYADLKAAGVASHDVETAGNPGALGRPRLGKLFDAGRKPGSRRRSE